ncbi:MAG: prolyl oligopeptidase family serine peptidase [Ferruginibacter sp.]
MKKEKIKITLTFLVLLHLYFGVMAQTKFNPPATPAIPVTDTLHGMYLTDNYRWLEDKDNEAVKTWTRAQHDYTLTYMNETQKTIKGLREEIAAIVDLDYEGPINTVGKRKFQTIKRKGDKQNKIYTILDNGEKKLIFDPVTYDTSGKTALSSSSYSYDGNICVYGIQKSGSEINNLYFIDTRTGKELYPPIEGVWGFSWTKDQQHGYITLRNKELIDKQQPLPTYLHKVGSSMKDNVFLGAPKDAKNSFYIYDNRYSDVTFLGESDFYSNTLRIKKTGTTDTGKIIYSSKKHRAYPEAIGDKMYILTNDNAPNFKLLIGNTKNPDSKNWKVLIPESTTVMEDYSVTKHNIIVQDKKDIVSRLRIFDFNGKYVKDVPMPEPGNISSFSYDREEDLVYLTIVSFTTPAKTFVAGAKDFKWKLYFFRELPVDTRNITGSIKFYTSKDGTKVPIKVIHRKGVKLDGNNPTILTGYGGFNAGIGIGFVGSYASFINRGGVLLEPGIRGGDEYGEKWHEGGMLQNKQTCFDDFIAAAEWAIREKYTNKNKLAISGGSNGGLLMGAMVTQRPELFKAVLCAVPLLDMVRYHKFLIARYWIPEYGSADNEKDFSWLLQYSPYHNIKQGVSVPNMLVTAGAYDSRVDPLHAKKFVAALQNNVGQKNPVMLWIDFDSGHGTGQQTKQIIDNRTMQMSYLMNQLGMQ